MAQKRKSKPSKVKKTRTIKPNKEFKPKEEVPGKYHMSILIDGELFETETDDIVESILALKPLKITNKIIINVKSGIRTFEKVLFVRMARRTFYNRLAAEFFAKTVMNGLK